LKSGEPFEELIDGIAQLSGLMRDVRGNVFGVHHPTINAKKTADASSAFITRTTRTGTSCQRTG